MTSPSPRPGKWDKTYRLAIQVTYLVTAVLGLAKALAGLFR
jgi:hypothetical protein